jgi:recombination protein RecT
MNYKPANGAIVPQTPTETVLDTLKKMKGEFANALPASIGLKPDRMVRILMTEVRKNPELAKSDQASFLGAVMQCAQLGLEPGVALGHAYLLPFRNKGKLECQLIVGYQGMIELAERDGRVTIDAHVVYEKDDFSYRLGLYPDIQHEPYTGTDDPGEVVSAYAVARYKDGRFKFRVISKRDIEDARKSSKAGSSKYSPWATHYAEMARKTAVRRLFKMLPKSTEISRVIEIEEKSERGESQGLESLVPNELFDHVSIDLDENEVTDNTAEKTTED